MVVDEGSPGDLLRDFADNLAIPSSCPAGLEPRTRAPGSRLLLVN